MAQMTQIKNYPNYFISEDGTVESRAQLKPKILKQQPVTQTKTYKQVRLFNKELFSRNGELHYIHRLVYETFVGDIPEDMTVDHVDDDPTNNQLYNLQLLTLEENHKKWAMKRLGHTLRSKTKEMQEDYEKFGSYKKVAEKWNISHAMCWRLINQLVQYKDKKDGKYKFRPYTDGFK
jgi:hypothetical protein